MSGFEAESLTLRFGQSFDMFVASRVLCNQGSSLDQIDALSQAFFVAKDLDIVHQICVRDICQWVRNP